MVIAQRVPIYNEKEKFCFFIPSFKLLILVKSFGTFFFFQLTLIIFFLFLFFFKKKILFNLTWE